MNCRFFFFLLLTQASACATGETGAALDRPVVREVIRDAKAPEFRERAWALLQQVQKSVEARRRGAELANCVPRSEVNSSDFVIEQTLSREKGHIELVDLIFYEEGTNSFELYVSSDKPQVADLVMRVLERDGECISFDLQMRVVETNGY
jgi:hypothetical protein